MLAGKQECWVTLREVGYRIPRRTGECGRAARGDWGRLGKVDSRARLAGGDQDISYIVSHNRIWKLFSLVPRSLIRIISLFYLLYISIITISQNQYAFLLPC